jgi:hypothetical protein
MNMDFKTFNKKFEERVDDKLKKIESSKLAQHLISIYEQHQVKHEKLKPEMV